MEPEMIYMERSSLDMSGLEHNGKSLQSHVQIFMIDSKDISARPKFVHLKKHAICQN